jgi:hypothetical protein
MKKILIACEYSGIVRDEFCKKGYNVFSCDILPTESERTKILNKHIQDDLIKVLKYNWDCIIAFPPCTDLSNAQAGPVMNKKILEGKPQKALEFIKKIWESSNLVSIENPLSSYLNNNWINYTQIIQPYYFGHNYMKRTCLWLKNLPPLISTYFVEPKFKLVDSSNKKNPKSNQKIKGLHRKAKDRSKFHSGVAEAMAQQWII